METIQKPFETFAIKGIKYISYEKVKEIVNQKTVDNGTSLFKNLKSKSWAFKEFGMHRYYAVDKLPNKSKKEISNLSFPEVALNDNLDSEILLILDFSYSHEKIWGQYKGYYEDRYFKEKNIEIFSRTHCIIKSLSNLVIDHDSYQKVFNAFEKFLFGEQCNKHEVSSNSKRRKRVKKVKLYNFSPGSYKYFERRLKEFKGQNIEKVLLHGNRNVTKGDIVLQLFYRNQMIHFYCQKKPVLKYRDILIKVNDEAIKRGFPQIKLSKVKMFLSNKEIQNTYKPFRLGRQWAKTQLPYLVREELKDVNEKWEIDGLCLPFYVFIENEDIVVRAWQVFVTEVKSKKVIGQAVGRSENAQTIIEAYKNSFIETRRTPFEIVRDNAPAYRKEALEVFERSLTDIKITIRKTKPGDGAQDKGSIENRVGVLKRNHYSKFSGFLGNGFNSSLEEHRLDPIDRKEFYKKHNAKSWKEINEIARLAITDFNNTAY